jgi:ABC-2 type transport system ATP-binding protein
VPLQPGKFAYNTIGEQCLYLAQMKGLSKAEAKKTWNIGFDRLGIQGWWNKKIRTFKGWLKIQFVVCVLHKPKLLILTNLFGFDPVNAIIIKDEILALRDRVQ